MTADPRLERALPQVLADFESSGLPAYTDRLLERTARTRQRPAWVFFERWLDLDVTAAHTPVVARRWRLILVTSLVIIALLVAAIVAGVGSGPRLPAPFGVARNGSIAFTEDGDILVTEPGTDHSVGLIVGPTFDSRAGYSPDGSMIGFLRRQDPAIDGASDLVVARPDGTGVRTITDVPLDAAPALWQWSADSRSVVLITAEGRMVVIDAIDHGPARVIDTGGIAMESPVFEPPDGRRVLFRGRSDAGTGVYVMDADGANLRALITPIPDLQDRGLGNLTWSPDGRQIAFHMVPESKTSQRIFVMHADGTEAHVVADTPGDFWDGYPNWSPDGSLIAFGRSDPASDTYVTAILDVDDGTVRTIGPAISNQVSSVGYWSPDGQEFLLVYSAGTGKNPVILDPDGGPDREVPWAAVAPIDWQRLAP